MPVIPAREPVGDVVHGVVLQTMAFSVDAAPESVHAVLVSGSDVTLPPELVALGRGNWIIRYGVRLLEKPRLSMVPGLLALDYGDMLTGEAAWEFLLKKSNLYPRADVVGYRSDGVDDMLPVKRLDLALPIEVLAYEQAQSTMPFASLNALILPDGANSTAETEPAAVPARLTQYLPIYDSIDGWQQSLKPQVTDDALANNPPADE